MKSKQIIISVFSAAVFIALTMADASAAAIRVRCDSRGGNSVVSVDGFDLTSGRYRAVVISGGITKVSRNTKPVVAPNDEAEFDYSSKLNDQTAGATAIPATFIKNHQVLGKIQKRKVTSTGEVVFPTVISDTVICRAR
jgi:hypothetical protein